MEIVLSGDLIGILDGGQLTNQSLLAVTYFPQRLAPPVSSALKCFTSVFGMGTGGATSLQPPESSGQFNSLQYSTLFLKRQAQLKLGSGSI